MILTENNIYGATIVTDKMIHHLKNDIPLYENVFRMGSEAYFQLIEEARFLHSKGYLILDEAEEELISTDIGKFALYEGVEVPLDYPMVNEAEYQGKDVELNKPKRGGSKKFYVYVKDGDKVKKVSFGADSGGGKLAVKLKDPKARKAFADRHNCKQKNDKTKAGYWSCRLPRYAKQLGLKGGGQWW